MIRSVMADLKVIDEAHKISDKRGNGKLRREVWVDEATRQITRYNLAYINHRLHAGDNGVSWATTMLMTASSPLLRRG